MGSNPSGESLVNVEWNDMGIKEKEGGAVRRLGAKNTAPGLDNILDLGSRIERPKEPLRQLFNNCLRTRQFPPYLEGSQTGPSPQSKKARRFPLCVRA